MSAENKADKMIYGTICQSQGMDNIEILVWELSHNSTVKKRIHQEIVTGSQHIANPSTIAVAIFNTFRSLSWPEIADI